MYPRSSEGNKYTDERPINYGDSRGHSDIGITPLYPTHHSRFGQSDTEKSDEESECYGTGNGPTLELPVLKVQSVSEVPLSFYA